MATAMTVQMSSDVMQISCRCQRSFRLELCWKDNPKGLAKGSERSLKPAKEAFKAVKLRLSTVSKL